MTWGDGKYDSQKMAWRTFSSPPRTRSLQERFDARLIPGPGDCWAWDGSHFKTTGYAQITVKHADGKWRPTVAHRVAYELYRAEIPEGLVLDHLCLNRGCVNPWHLEPVPQAENIKRSLQARGYTGIRHVYGPERKRWTLVTDWDGRCHRGHIITRESTFTRRDGGHECRLCMQDRSRARSATAEYKAYQKTYQAAYYQKRKAARLASAGRR